MRILALSDKEDLGLWNYYAPEKVEGVDLIIACGDLKKDYLEFLVTMINKPLLYVNGNHDRFNDNYYPEGCENIDGKLFLLNDLRVLGLGGSNKYSDEAINMYSQKQMKKRVNRIKKNIKRNNGFDILVAHAPIKGYGDQEDIAHQGFEVFEDLINQYKPKIMLHGHIHREYGNFQRIINHPSGTTLINCFESVIFDIDFKKDNNNIVFHRF